MERKFAELQRIDHDEEVTKENHYEFLYQLQNALLLGLKDQGRLNSMQYRHAAEKLNAQRQERAKKIRQLEECP